MFLTFHFAYFLFVILIVFLTDHFDLVPFSLTLNSLFFVSSLNISSLYIISWFSVYLHCISTVCCVSVHVCFHLNEMFNCKVPCITFRRWTITKHLFLFQDRSEKLKKAYRLMIERKDELAKIITLENVKKL